MWKWLGGAEECQERIVNKPRRSGLTKVKTRRGRGEGGWAEVAVGLLYDEGSADLSVWWSAEWHGVHRADRKSCRVGKRKQIVLDVCLVSDSRSWLVIVMRASEAKVLSKSTVQLQAQVCSFSLTISNSGQRSGLILDRQALGMILEAYDPR
ncbi:hypothetical protein P175DRAFT_0167289 [Aspergillus ochraceoroseus IBT 24754]|uniref:Uncharacterized protein n=1 Tax=Aspergillus ochraceoroseus IBT 24754 TaxID=1392256 RepID=A0A2T5M458_9EURO|nr:uncharacterized protein P175DRAFT_0167289 [Aspergillus ochraceoroseus IBT 24754]PTU23323.1 hypothetical protein P175DRAFT_0167289 [Aspergillus ochraceoroseus IBT 24754]